MAPPPRPTPPPPPPPSPPARPPKNKRLRPPLLSCHTGATGSLASESVTPINFVSPPFEPLDDQGRPYGGPLNRRAEMWLKSKEWLESVEASASRQRQPAGRCVRARLQV